MKYRPIFKLLLLAGWLTALLLTGTGCGTVPSAGQLEPRRGDEIVAAGQCFHTGTLVVLWLDPGGYDGYRVERHFGPVENSTWQTSHTNNPELTTPNRYGERVEGLSSNE